MARALWSGSIAFGLVNVPVRMYSAIDEHDLEFHLVHVTDGSRIGYQKVCKAEDRPVPNDEVAKGYEVDGELVLLDAEDFAAAESDGYRTIEILAFVTSDEIDPIYYERSYYLGPQEGGEKVYRLLVEAMDRAGLAAVVRYVFHDREHLGALRVRDGVLVAASMYFADEIRPTADIRPERRTKVDSRELEMALELIDRFKGSFEPSEYHDTYRERLLEIVEAKRRGGETQTVAVEEPRPTPDLLTALRESIERHTRDGSGRAAKERSNGDDLDGLTVDELNARARELGIEGRSKMSKRQLLAAVAKHET